MSVGSILENRAPLPWLLTFLHTVAEMWLTSKETTGGKEGGQPEIGQACREGAAAGAEEGVESVSYAKAMDFCLSPGDERSVAIN